MDNPHQGPVGSAFLAVRIQYHHVYCEDRELNSRVHSRVQNVRCEAHPKDGNGLQSSGHSPPHYITTGRREPPFLWEHLFEWRPSYCTPEGRHCSRAPC